MTRASLIALSLGLTSLSAALALLLHVDGRQQAVQTEVEDGVRRGIEDGMDDALAPDRVREGSRAAARGLVDGLVDGALEPRRDEAARGAERDPAAPAAAPSAADRAVQVAEEGARVAESAAEEAADLGFDAAEGFLTGEGRADRGGEPSARASPDGGPSPGGASSPDGGEARSGRRSLARDAGRAARDATELGLDVVGGVLGGAERDEPAGGRSEPDRAAEGGPGDGDRRAARSGDEATNGGGDGPQAADERPR